MGPKDISGLDSLTKASLLSGKEANSTLGIESLGLRNMHFSDGPSGLRKMDQGGNSLSGISKSLPATCFPSPSTLANSFDRDLLYRIGRQIGKECAFYGVDLLLGPAVNIARNPLCGRNFEYLGEDPLLSGYLAASYISGVQSQRVGSCLKHAVGNEIEKFRFVGDSEIDEKALREIYLKPFEIAIRESDPAAVMTSYNQINGEFASQSEWLINGIFKGEWGYCGLVMTDWGGTKDRVSSIKAGNDMEMPGMIEENDIAVAEAIDSGEIEESKVEDSISRLLRLESATRGKPAYGEGIFEEGYRLSLEACLKSSVLLKNDGSFPLDKGKKYLFVGDYFTHVRYQGSGSAMLNPYRLREPIDVFAGKGASFDHARGYDSEGLSKKEKLFSEALRAAEGHQDIVFFGGLTDFQESEGYDREDMDFPDDQKRLIAALLERGKKIGLVLFSGSPVALPFVEKLSFVLYVGLPGEAGAEGIYRLLYGYEKPSGRLSVSWYKDYSDIPFGNEYGSSPIEVYRESVFVGYRYNQSVPEKVLFRFGEGILPKVKATGLKCHEENGRLIFETRLENPGTVAYSLPLLLYFGVECSATPRPRMSLCAFRCATLKPHESKTFEIAVNKADLRLYDRKVRKFVLEKGTYLFSLSPGNDADSLELRAALDGEGVSFDGAYVKAYGNPSELAALPDSDFEAVLGRKIPVFQFPSKPYTLETPVYLMKGLVGTLFSKAIRQVGLIQYRKGKRIKDAVRREREMKAGYFVARLLPYNSLRSMSFSSSGLFKLRYAKAILQLINNHPLKAFKALGKPKGKR